MVNEQDKIEDFDDQVEKSCNTTDVEDSILGKQDKPDAVKVSQLPPKPTRPGSVRKLKKTSEPAIV